MADPLLSFEGLIAVLERIATAQEQMVCIAMESRDERLKLAKAMSDKLKAGFTAEK